NGVANNIMDGWLFTPQIQTLFVSTVQQTLKNAETERANILSFVDYEDLSPENQKQLDRGLLGSPTGIEFIVDRVWDALSAQWGGLGTRPRAKVKTTGTGRRRATPAEIRARFDLDELTELANNIWRGKLLEEPDNARAMASAYVDAVVASKGEQRIDFTQFITERARATSRYASIYKNKPESVSDEQFLQPYFQAATQTLRPGNAARVAIGGAQLGMDAQTFAGRISREDEVTGSAPYVNQLYNRMSAVKGVFRG
ncbi:MAG: hypothetical protein GWO44_17810, partial [Thermoplasmata archaeon]|nr:hypothetical protein [Thermoplasmata archaeon]NIY05056.1 hypothetical protein [Thermoplasmata archaeon]